MKTSLKVVVVLCSLVSVLSVAFLISNIASAERLGHRQYGLSPQIGSTLESASLPESGLTTILDGRTKVRVNEAYGNLPLSFEANRGQTDGRVKFLSRSRGYSVFLTSSEAVLAFGSVSQSLNFDSAINGSKAPTPKSETKTAQLAVLRMKLIGGNSSSQVEGREELPGKINYFVGNDRAKWRTDVPTYGKVHYSEVYPGIDLDYRGNQNRLEYDFVVAPGADPRAIRVRFEGANRVRVDRETGELLLRLGSTEVRFERPIVYQFSDGEKEKKQFISARYLVNGNTDVRFEIGDYDQSKPLVIDPTLSYSTYLGGSGSDSGNGIAVDGAGNTYVVGTTYSANFPTSVGAFQITNKAPYNAFVTKLNPTGTAIVYSTYLGGNGGGFYNDVGQSIAVDASGNAYVTGGTNSTNFPVTPGAFQPSFAGGGFTGCCFPGDAFITKLNPTGSALLYSTYLGGSGWDYGSSITLDAGGNAYLAGQTHSTNYPVSPGAFDTTYNGSSGCGGNTNSGFVTKMNATGTGIVYSTFLGGSGFDSASAIAIDAVGNAYVTGTGGSNFPTTAGAFQSTLPGPSCPGSAFVTKLNSSGTSLVYSTYLGGSNGYAAGQGIAVDGAGNAHVAGYTASNTFPTTPGSFQTTHGGGSTDGFVSKLNATGSTLLYSSYLGGSGDDTPRGIVLDPAGNSYLTGHTSSLNFPTTPGSFQPANQGATDAFLAQLNPTATVLLYSTFFGGNGDDYGFATTLDAGGNAYLTGQTGSSNFPTTPSSVQTTNNGGTDAFIAKFAFAAPTPTPTPTPTPSPVACNIVTNTNDSGPNSLRAAITCANLNSGPDTISFNIPVSDPGFNSSVFVIRPLSALPALTDSGTTIDGSTQITFTGDTNTAGPEVVVNGSLAGFSAPHGGGLNILSAGNHINSLVINGFTTSGTGIMIYGPAATGNRVTGCYIGTNSRGLIANPNSLDGVAISTQAANNTIGGTTPQERNVISANGRFGVLLFGTGLTVSNNVIAGNFIGTNRTGLVALGNGTGVGLVTASSNTIGGTAPGAGNVISGNAQEGIHSNSSSSQTIQGNYIGTDVTGTAAIPNGFHGINLFTGATPSANNVIGGAAVGAGNLISGNLGAGIATGGASSDNNVIQGNRIGTDAAGTAPLGNTFDGISTGNANNIIGGTIASARNIISGNGGNGITIYGTAATGNQVQGNLVGTDAAGNAAIANGAHGIILIGAPNNTIGGTASGSRNIVSGNAGTGINISGSANQVQGNFIGTNAGGNAAVPNLVGVIINSSGNTIGGTSATARNVISGNANNQLRLLTSGATLNTVQGNYIGVNATGTGALGGVGNGIGMNQGASSNLIGGTAPGAGNVMSGNGGSGILCRDVGTSNNTIQGNFIGTNAAGSAALPNQADGIRIVAGASDNLVGGTAPGAGNIVSGNLGHGVHIDDFPTEEGGPNLGTARITVQGNRIGTDAGGTNPIGNRLPGVIILGGASDNLIGGSTPGAGNVVAFTTGGTIDDGEGNFITDPGAGISVADDGNVSGDGGGGNSARNRISQNTVFSNNGLGIDLNGTGLAPDTNDGPTANDSCDTDTGANNLQNTPQLNSVCHTGNSATIQGTLNSVPGTTFTVEFFANAACDSSGSGEGQTYLGSIQVTTDATCTVNFSFTGTTPSGQPFVTATATDPAGNTSEFSNCLTDVDTDGDGASDCLDSCPTDPNKTNPGACGCGVPDTDTDSDGTANCLDSCPTDPNKINPGVCGCGVADTDSDSDGTPDCNDTCPNDPNKINPGVCGCGVADTDTDGDGTANCLDSCPTDPNKTAPGACGCGVADTDADGDGVPNCIDNCPNTPNSSQADWDQDGIGDACDPPVEKNQCKNGGWKNFTFPQSFSSQGECIRWFNKNT